MKFPYFLYDNKKTKLFTSIFLIVFSFTLSGCATIADNESASDPKDPLESINRPLWTFNWDYLDKYVTKPVATAYAEYTPKPVRNGMYNFVRNLDEPATIINNLLQLKFTDAAKSTGRFVLNSTIGVLGIFDPASDFGWTRKKEEFGEVLGSYGVGDGAYLMLPFLGPNSVREGVGDYVDKLYWPLAVIDFWPNILRLGIKGLELRTQLVEQESLINESIDPYIFIKNAYFQNMRFKVYDGNPPIEINDKEDKALESFMDELDEN